MNVKLEGLIDLRRARVRNLSKLSDLQLEENCEMICKQINNFPALRGERILVDTNLDNLMNTEMAFTELCHLHGDRNGAESKQTKKYSMKTYFTFSLIEAKQVETMKFGKVNYMIGLFHPISGFVTDLFSYEDMDNEVLAEQNGNRKFVVPDEFKEDDLYLVLMVIFTDGSQAKTCKGIGLTKLETVFNTSELKLDITPNKDSTVSVMDLISKCLKEKEHDKNMFKFTFQIKEVEESFLNAEDFVFQRVSVPTLIQTGVSKYEHGGGDKG